MLQWGTFPTNGSSNPRTITYPQPFADNNYVLTLTLNAGGASQGNRSSYIYNNSKTKTNVQVTWVNSNDIYWQAIGYY